MKERYRLQASLGKKFPKRIFFNVISLWFAGGDEAGGEEFHQ